jgi:DNA-binding MarR family transcriptional regulator
MTITVREQVFEFIETHPFLTAWKISSALGLKSSTVSSVLRKEWERGRIERCLVDSPGVPIRGSLTPVEKSSGAMYYFPAQAPWR